MEGSPFNSNNEAEDSSDAYESLDDDSTEKKADKKKIPKRSLFLNAEKPAGDKSEKLEKADAKKKEGLFAGLLKSEVEPSAESEAEKSVQAPEAIESAIEESVEEAPSEVAQEFSSFVEVRIEQVDAEVVAGSEPEHIGELLADAELLENIHERLDEGMSPDSAIENAVSEALENPMPDADELDLVQHPEVFDGYTAPEADPVVADEDEPLAPTSPTSSSGAGTPPTPPPPTSNSASPNFPPTPSPNAYSQALNTQPASLDTEPDSPDLVPMNEHYSRDRNTGKVLLAGGLGYLFGKKRGRIKTEERLEPVIKSKEEDIKSLSGKLEDSEERIRKAASEATAEARKTSVEELKIPERPSVIPAETIAEERKEFTERQEKFEKVLVDDEVVVLQGETQHENDVEKQIVETDMLQVARLEQQKEEQEKAEEAKKKAVTARFETSKTAEAAPEKKQDVRTMTLPKVLEAAEFINVNQMNLRQLYESRRIDSVNLRRVVSEYLKGGNYERVLEQSLEAVEIRSELKHEIKQDDSVYKPPAQTASNVVDGLIAATKNNPEIQGKQVAQNAPTATFDPTTQATVDDAADDRLTISNGTAIVLGILAGVFFMLMILLYSDLL